MNMRSIMEIVTAHVRSTREGNLFSLFVHRGGGYPSLLSLVLSQVEGVPQSLVPGPFWMAVPQSLVLSAGKGGGDPSHPVRPRTGYPLPTGSGQGCYPPPPDTTCHGQDADKYVVRGKVRFTQVCLKGRWRYVLSRSCLGGGKGTLHPVLVLSGGGYVQSWSCQGEGVPWPGGPIPPVQVGYILSWSGWVGERVCPVLFLPGGGGTLTRGLAWQGKGGGYPDQITLAPPLPSPQLSLVWVGRRDTLTRWPYSFPPPQLDLV